MRLVLSLMILTYVSSKRANTYSGVRKCCRGICSTYRGYVNTTVTGAKCQPWADLPATHKYHPDKKPNSGLESNYCRNPSKHRNAWCYVKIQGGTNWQNCRVPRCVGTLDTTCCRSHGNCRFYRGFQSTTTNGLTCQRWDALPRPHRYHPDNKPMSGLDSNYCRNPSGFWHNAWCYVKIDGSKTAWANCDIDQCQIPMYWWFFLHLKIAMTPRAPWRHIGTNQKSLEQQSWNHLKSIRLKLIRIISEEQKRMTEEKSTSYHK